MDTGVRIYIGSRGMEHRKQLLTTSICNIQIQFRVVARSYENDTNN